MRIPGSARCRMTRRAILTVTAGDAGDLRRPSPRRSRRARRGPRPARRSRGRRPPRRSMVRPVSTMSLTTPCAADLEQPAHPAGVGDDAVADLGKHEPGPLGGDADVTEQRPLERSPDRPALDGHDDRRVEVEDLQHAPMAAGHQLVVGERGDVGPDRPRRPAPTTTPCPRPARSPPAPPACCLQLGRGSRRGAASISSSKALCLSGLLLVITATESRISSETLSVIDAPLDSGEGARPPGGGNRSSRPRSKTGDHQRS